MFTPPRPPRCCRDRFHCGRWVADQQVLYPSMDSRLDFNSDHRYCQQHPNCKWFFFTQVSLGFGLWLLYLIMIEVDNFRSPPQELLNNNGEKGCEHQSWGQSRVTAHWDTGQVAFYPQMVFACWWRRTKSFFERLLQTSTRYKVASKWNRKWDDRFRQRLDFRPLLTVGRIWAPW